MKKMLFELLISPLSISDNYFVNYFVIALIGLIAFKVAFKIVGDIGVRGEIGSLLHWTIRLITFVLIWGFCCLTISAVKFIVEHIVLLSVICIGSIAIYKVYDFYEVNFRK